jgi:hypothetical protein
MSLLRLIFQKISKNGEKKLNESMLAVRRRQAHIFGLAVRKAPPTKSLHAETPWKKVANSREKPIPTKMKSLALS